MRPPAIRVVERCLSKDEYRREHFEAYDGPIFWDDLCSRELETLIASVGHIAVLDVHGSLMGSDSQELSVHVQRLLSRGEQIIVINLAGMNVFDTEGAGDLVKSSIAIARAGSKMPLVNLPISLRRILEHML